MKKILLTATLASLAALSLRADLIYYEPWSYDDGATTNVSAGAWRIHSTGGTQGTPAGNDSFVRSNRLEISGNSNPVPGCNRQADINRPFCTSSCTYTSSPISVYASFTLNCTNLPGPTATAINYIAHFFVNSSTFPGRMFQMRGQLPNTFRLGISGTNNTVNRIFPVDLASNVDYQVVVGWNPTASDDPPLFSRAATLWINPFNSGSASVSSSDSISVGPSLNPVTGYAFRQASGTTSFFCNITNLATATTYNDAAANVFWPASATAPIVAYPPLPASGTNFDGATVTYSVVAAGQDPANMIYQWRKDGLNISNPNGNTNVLTLGPITGGDSGTYDVVVTTSQGQSATSAGAYLWVTNPPVPPTITVQPPTNTTVFTHQNATIGLTAVGPQPITYSWKYNGGALGGNVTGDGTDTITITDATAPNAGTYTCDVSNTYGTTTSTNAVLVVTNPPAVSIAYLRTLVDSQGFAPTNTSQLWTATGMITTLTNLTSGNTASYYLQDSTAGINLFCTFGSTFRPNMGDVVTAVGFLSTFIGNLELLCNMNDPAQTVTVHSNNIALYPVARLLSWDGIATNFNADLEYNHEGAIVMLTNVYFGANAGIVTTNSGNFNYLVTNSSGKVGHVYLYSSQDQDVTNHALPAFAYAVQGPLVQVTNTSPGYLVNVTRWADIMTDPISISVSKSGNNATITWNAIPLTYSYSVYASATPFDVARPVAGTKIATGLKFATTTGVFTDPNATGATKFYRVTSP